MGSLYGTVLLAGIANAVEPGQNGTLARVMGEPLLAGSLCFGLALLCFLLGVLIVGRRALPVRGGLARVPWWSWPGGLLGAGIVAAQLYLAERLGAAPFLGLVVTGGVIASIILDHYGLVGFECRRAGRGRLIGGALMIVGVTLVALF